MKTTLTPTRTPTHDDPCECHEERERMGATSRSVDTQLTSCSCRHRDDAALRELSLCHSLESCFWPDGRLRHDFRLEHQLEWCAGWHGVCRVRGFGLCRRDTDVEGVHSDDGGREFCETAASGRSNVARPRRGTVITSCCDTLDIIGYACSEPPG